MSLNGVWWETHSPWAASGGKSIVYGDDSFKDNPDTYNPKYNTECGMYEPNCGLENLMISWGHDEYLYRVLVHNKSKFPKEGLFMIRYHSLYPWHAGGDYKHLMKEGDEEIMKHVLEFNKYDLYTKSAAIPDIEALWPYYEKLIEKYIPGVLEW